MGKRVLTLTTAVILALGSFNLYAVEALPDNVTQSDTGTANDNVTNSNPVGNSDLKNDTGKLADDLGKTGGDFLQAMDGVFKSMGDADDGKVFTAVSKVMSKPVAAIVQIVRGSFLLILVLMTVPDFIALLVPGLEGRLSGGNSGNSGGMGSGSTGGKKGLLSEDYFDSVGDKGGMSGEQGKKKHRIVAYVQKRTVTLLAATFAFIILLSPFGFTLLIFVVRMILTGATKLVTIIAGS